MIRNIKSDAETRMGNCIEIFRKKINKIRTGRAYPHMLDHITVKYSGISIPLFQLANITVENAHTLKISLFDPSAKKSVEKSIINSNLGLNPNSHENEIHVSFPPLNEKNRKDLIKIVHTEAEQARIAIRNIRRDLNNQIKILLKAKEINKDIDRRLQEDVQTLTNSTIKKLNQILEKKEKDLLNS